MKKVLLVVITSIAPGCGPPIGDLSSAGPADPLTGTGAVERLFLARQSFERADGPTVVPNQGFALPVGAASSLHQLEGRLSLSPLTGRTGVRVIEGNYLASLTERDTARPDNTLPNDEKLLQAVRLPRITVDWIQHGSHLIPANRGLVYSGDPVWNYIVGPGRAWSELDDDGWSRASAPFALVERDQNCVHNGVMTFLFNSQAVSDVRYQITQENCRYRKFDLWGVATASYDPGPVAQAEELRRAYDDEVAQRVPVRQIGDLFSELPGMSVDAMALLPEIELEHLTVHGVEVEGIHYRGRVRTRTGDYPFPESMRLPSYSTAKTAFAAVALMRLAQRDGIDMIRTRVTDLVPEAAASPQNWAGVTLEDLLDMATGHYREITPHADEGDDLTMVGFFGEEALHAKLEASLSYPRREEPGRDWVYHTTDTFLLIQALQNYLRAHDGSHTDVFHLVRDDVFIPLGLSSGSFETLRTDNSTEGLPFGGFGLFWSTDDIIKMATFLNRDNGRIGADQVLHPDMLAATMQQDVEDRGLRTDWGRYNNGVWAYTLESREPEVDSTWITQMRGFGGIIVAMLPSGASYYYFSDGGQFSADRAVTELDRLFHAIGNR